MKTELDIEELLNDQLPGAALAKWRADLVIYVNDLLLNDFNKLVQLLYKIDVEEKKLKILLKQNPSEDAAILITDLLLMRLQEKAKTKQQFKSPEDISEDEKW